MADATLRGAFELSAEQPIRSLTTIRDRGREADASLRTLGTTMDRLATRSETTARRIESSWSAIDRSVETHVTRIEGRVDRLEGKLRDLGRVKSTPSVELNGFDKVNAQISELEHRLNSLGRQRATPRVGLGGGFGGGGTGGVGTPTMGGGGAGRAPTLFSAVGGIPTMVLAALGLGPGLVGGATALAGSAGSAALGAGAVGLGGLATLGAGVGLTAAAVRPAVQGLQAITKAQQAYTTAVQEYGRASAQAATEKRKLDAALVATPAAAGTARQLSLFRQDYRRAFAPAQNAFYQGASGVLYNARRALPSLGASANIATSATAAGAVSFSNFLSQPAQLSTVRTLVQAFASELPTAERTLENITTTMGHLAVAAIPFFHEANVWVEHWSAGLARSSGDTVRVRSTMRDMVNSAKDWAHLLGAGGKTLRDLFSAGRPTGDSMVVTLTHTLDRWDQWIQRNPAKVQAWFHQAESTVSHIASAIAGIVHLIGQVGSALSPIVSRGLDLISAVSSLGPGGLPLLYGAYQGARGALGGRGPGPLAAARGLVTGSAVPFIAAGGGARGGGGTIVGGGSAYAGALASTQTRYRGGISYPRPTLGQPIPAGALGSELPLLAAIGGARYAGTISGGITASPESFAARYGGIEGARFAGPELVAARNYGLSRLAGPLAGVAGGAARFLGPTAALLGVLQGIQTPGGIGHKVNAGVSTAASTLTLGAVSPGSFEHVLHSAFGTDNAGASLSGPAAGSIRALAAQAGNVRTPQQLQTVRERVQFQLGPGSAEFSPADQAKIRHMMSHVLATAAGNAGAQASNTWQDAFTRSLDRGTRPERAVGTMLSGMRSQIKQLGPQGGRAFAQDTATWAHQMEQDNPRLRRPIERLMNGIVDDLNRLQKHTGNKMRDLRDQVFYFNGQILQGTDTTWGAIRDSLVNKASVAQEKLSGIWGQIQSEAINALTQMGFSKDQAKAIVTQTAKGGQAARNANLAVSVNASGGGAFAPLSPTAPSGVKKARGGQIGGRGLLDTVSLPSGDMAAPGEAWIANRHTMMDLDRAAVAMYGKPAWEMIRDEHRPHSAPMHYSGGRNKHLLGGLLTGIGQVAQRAAGSVASATQTGASGVTTSTTGKNAGMVYGYSRVEPESRVDQGLDYVGAGPIFAIGSGTVTRNTIWPGWPGTGGVVYTLDSGPYAGRNVYNMEHVQARVSVGQHVAAGQYIGDVLPGYPWLEAGWADSAGARPLTPYNGAADGTPMPGGIQFRSLMHALKSGGQLPPGGGLGGAIANVIRSISIKAPRSGLRGMPGALVDQASRVLTAGMQTHVNAQLGGGAAPGGVPASAGGGIMSIAQQAAAAMGVPFDAGIVSTLLQKESGGGQNLGPSGPLSATGPFQVIPSTFRQYEAPGHGNIMNPYDNALAAFNYIRQRYHTLQGLAGSTGLMGGGYHGYELGGHVKWAGWHARGVNAIANGPTLFGAGEGGRSERVRVEPISSNSSRGRGGHSILVRMENVHLSAQPEQIEKIGREVAEKILGAIDEVGGSETSDAELLAQ